jgi:hypothetical protein
MTSDDGRERRISDLAVRVETIQEAITYSRQFRDRWFVVHVSPSSIEAAPFSQDLRLLRSLAIHVAVVVAEDAYPEPESLGVDLRKALNRDEITAVVLHWEETRSDDFPMRRPPRWQELAENSSLIVLVRCARRNSLRAAQTLGIECSAAKLLLLEREWDPSALPVGGPGSTRPCADEVRPFLRSLDQGSSALTIAVEAVEAGIDEAHVVPTVDNPHPILVEIFTDSGIGTWIGP